MGFDASSMDLPSDFKELLELFNAHGVEYLIVGGYALAFHGVPPVRVDIITSVSGVSWEKTDAGKTPGRYDETPVFFIGRDDFLANKRATGRAKDAADIEALGE
jgi:hypothetical protein